MEAELYARMADDGTLINEGYEYYDGEGFIADEYDAERWAEDEGYASLQQAIDDGVIAYVDWTEDPMSYQYAKIGSWEYVIEMVDRI